MGSTKYLSIEVLGGFGKYLDEDFCLELMKKMITSYITFG